MRWPPAPRSLAKPHWMSKFADTPTSLIIEGASNQEHLLAWTCPGLLCQIKRGCGQLGLSTHVFLDSCRGIGLKPGDIERAIEEMKHADPKILKSSEVSRSCRLRERRSHTTAPATPAEQLRASLRCRWFAQERCLPWRRFSIHRCLVSILAGLFRMGRAPLP
jgi:hypothetical protein